FFSAASLITDDNLQSVSDRLLNRPEKERADLLSLYGQVRGRRWWRWWVPRVAADETDPRVSQLRLSGVTRAADGHLRVRNRIYGRVFDRAWVRSNMQGAVRRRQRKGLLRGS